jgi:hypothetical protein
MSALLRLPRFTHPPPVEASRRPGVLPETVSMSGWDRGLRLVALLVARAPSTWPFGAVDSRTARMAGRRPCHAQLVTPTGGLQLPAAPRKTWWQRLVDWLAGAAVLHQRPAGTETLGPNDSRERTIAIVSEYTCVTPQRIWVHAARLIRRQGRAETGPQTPLEGHPGRTVRPIAALAPRKSNRGRIQRSWLSSIPKEDVPKRRGRL